MKIVKVECGILERKGRKLEVKETFYNVEKETKHTYLLENGVRIWKRNLGVGIDGFRYPFDNGCGYMLYKKIYLKEESIEEINKFKEENMDDFKKYLRRLVEDIEKSYVNAMETKANLENM
ncbi:MAG: hypothetical protein ACRC1T_04820 [Clostridium chrysemydis]|uniref:hypothetical protein n=1 Tax=Clostridium chrysemydis TaxID=2665504 RepID=UPI003F35FAC4